MIRVLGIYSIDHPFLRHRNNHSQSPQTGSLGFRSPTSRKARERIAAPEICHQQPFIKVLRTAANPPLMSVTGLEGSSSPPTTEPSDSKSCQLEQTLPTVSEQASTRATVVSSQLGLAMSSECKTNTQSAWPLIAVIA